MNEGLIPRRYAKALYEVASSRGSAESLYAKMCLLSAEAVATPELQRTLSNPYISDTDKSRLLLTAAAASESDTVYADWLRVLGENRRMGMAPDIARAYIEFYRQERHIYPVTVSSAVPLAPEESARIRSLIQSHIGPDASMEYAERINPDLIGGFAIDIANERLDASVRNKLDTLRLNLLKKQ